MADKSQHAGMQHETSGVKISVIMPVYNAVAYISRSLPPLIEMLRNHEILEVIVVDDSSNDETPQLAVQLGAQVIPSGGRLGPGGARNCAAGVAVGDILWFVDADVIVARDAAHTLATGFTEPDVVAVFGAYDDQPPAHNFLSQYKNLVHHYYHNRSRREAATFWSGCGAVRKEAFLQVGGFDIELFTRPSIEDIELGYRMRDAGGRILLLPDLRGTHLKEWRLLNLLHTEIFCRAIPWSRLILTRTGLHNDLNVTPHERVRAGLAGLLMIVLISALLGIASWWIAVTTGTVVMIANRHLIAFFYRRKGLGFALRGALFHQLYYLYSSAAFVWCWIEIKVLRLHPRRVVA